MTFNLTNIEIPENQIRKHLMVIEKKQKRSVFFFILLINIFLDKDAVTTKSPTLKLRVFKI